MMIVFFRGLLARLSAALKSHEEAQGFDVL
jgi:hypothetical protein